MKNFFRKWRLRMRAREAYRNVQDIRDAMNCGWQMTLEVSATAYRYARDFNNAMDELAKLDPMAPKFRFDLGVKP